MYMMTMTIGWLLLAQLAGGVDNAAPSQPPAKAAVELQTGESQPPDEPGRYRLTPLEMVAEAMTLPPGHRLTGRPMTLLTAVSASRDRNRQLEVTHAYWRLVEAVAMYHFSWEYDRRLRQTAELEGLNEGQAALLPTARASSTALLREAELAAVVAQHELAALALRPAGAPLPLPADRPHLGPYVTQFDSLFARRRAPAGARLIDRTLPIRRRAIEGRAAAVTAAQDALAATLDAQRQGQLEVSAVLTCMRQYLRQQQALIRSVRLYNSDIADYALVVVAPGTGAQELIAMLIGPKRAEIRPLVAEDAVSRIGKSNGASAVERTVHEEQVPTRAVRPKKTPTAPATPADIPEESDKQPPSSDAGWAPSASSQKTGPTLMPPQTGSAPLPPAEEPAQPTPERAKRPLVPVEPGPLRPIPMETDKPVVQDASPLQPVPDTLSPPSERSESPVATPALYSGLVDATPGSRAKQLALALHWDRSLPEDVGSPITLEACLRSSPAAGRLTMIQAYWRARQRAAEYQVVLSQAELVGDLSANASPDDRRGLLRLHSAKLTTAAAVHEAHAALVEAQFELARRIGRESDTQWPVPETTPHSGPYLLKLDEQPRTLVESWPLRRLAATIPVLADHMRERATAVVEADRARAAAAGYAGDTPPLEQILSGISRQTDETLAFLQAITDYNQAIAEYALAVLPADVSPERLTAALVVH